MRHLPITTIFRLAMVGWLSACAGAVGADLTKLGLSAEEQKRLERDKVLVVQESWPQVFSPYLDPAYPAFVTSDSVLGAFHALLETTVKDLEQSALARTQMSLNDAWVELPKIKDWPTKDPALRAAGLARAQLVIGLALRLLNEPLPKCPKALREPIERLARAIEKGEGMIRPEFLLADKPGFPGIDAARFQPRSFYNNTERMQRYFRTITWLQEVPFFVESDVAMVASCGLYSAFRTIGGDLSLPINSWLGPAHELEIFALELGAENLDQWRATIAKREFTRRHVPSDFQDSELATSPPPPSNLRLVSPAKIPDAEWFAHLKPPSGTLGICLTAALGSEYGKRTVTPRLDEKQRKHLEGARIFFTLEKTVYAEYLDCLRKLLDAPEPDAPPLFGSDAWQAKACQTTAASWAWMRNTWALHTPVMLTVFASPPDTPAGFVEPDPAFFARLGQLAEGIATQLRPELDQDEFQKLVHRWAKAKPRKKLTDAQVAEALVILVGRAEELMPLVISRLVGKPPEEYEYQWGDVDRIVEALPSVIKSPKHVDLLQLAGKPLGTLLELGSARQQAGWRQLAGLCATLETLAQKQLRKEKFSDADAKFLHGYGSTLAGLMGTGALNPLYAADDAPRAAAIHTWTAHESLAAVQWDHAALGRPWTIYVLYPREGKEVLSRGAVFSYYEPSVEKPLTDAEWKVRLDAPTPPPPAEWTAPVLSSEPHAPWKPSPGRAR